MIVTWHCMLYYGCLLPLTSVIFPKSYTKDIIIVCTHMFTQTRPQTCDTGQTSYPAGVRRSHSDWGPSTKSPAIPPPPSSSELPLSPRQLTRSAEGLSSNKSVTLDSYVPVPVSLSLITLMKGSSPCYSFNVSVRDLQVARK